MRRWLLTLLTGMVLAASTPVRASEAADDAPFRPATSGPLVSFTAPLTPHRKLVLQPILGGTFTRGAYGPRGEFEQLAPGESLWAANALLFTEWGVHPRLVLGAQGGLQHNRRTLGARTARSTQPVDTLVYARARVLSERRSKPWPELAAFAQVKLPTGRANPEDASSLGTDVTGSGSVEGTFGFNATRGLKPLLLHLDTFFNLALPGQIDGVRTRYAPSFSWSAAAELPLPRTSGPLAVTAELQGRHQGARKDNGQRVADSQIYELVVGAGLEVLFSEHLQLLIGWQRTLLGRNVPAADALILTVVPVLF